MYKENNGLVEWHLDESFDNDFKKICDKFEVQHDKVKFYSQQDEDKYILQYVLKEKIDDGTFLELGACDGILYSNTKTLDDYFNFSGILIEPIKHYYDYLLLNRPNQTNLNFAISNSNKDYVEFEGTNAEAGITEHLNKKQNTTKYNVKNKKLSEVIKDSKISYLDILIVDVEGAEFSVIESIDFDFPIYCIFFEAHSDQQLKNRKISDFLITKGFEFKERQRGNEVWYNPNYHRRNLFKL